MKRAQQRENNFLLAQLFAERPIIAREIAVMNTFIVTAGRYLRTSIRRQYPEHLEAVIIFGGENRAAPRRAMPRLGGRTRK